MVKMEDMEEEDIDLENVDILSNIDEEIGDEDIDEEDEELIRAKLAPEYYSDFQDEDEKPADLQDKEENV